MSKTRTVLAALAVALAVALPDAVIAAPPADAAELRVAVFARHYAYAGAAFDDLDRLQAAAGAAPAGAVAFDLCDGADAARAWMAAAHRFRARPQRPVALDRGAQACMAPLLRRAAARDAATRLPSGIDDDAVLHYWRALLP